MHMSEKADLEDRLLDRWKQSRLNSVDLDGIRLSCQLPHYKVWEPLTIFQIDVWTQVHL
jgi:hypothetical protein